MFTSVAARAVRCPPKEGVSSDASGHSSPPDPSEVLPAGARAAGWGSNPPNRDTFGQGTHVNDAERLARDPVMRAIVGREGMDRPAASTSQMGRFETEWLASEANLAALTDLSGAWIDRVHERRPPDGIILDMDSFCHWAVEGNGFLCWAVEGSGSVASTGRHASVRDPRWGGHMRRSAPGGADLRGGVVARTPRAVQRLRPDRRAPADAPGRAGPAKEAGGPDQATAALPGSAPNGSVPSPTCGA